MKFFQPEKLLLTLTAALLLPAALLSQQPPQVLGEVFAGDATLQGSVVLAGDGMKLLSGSSISAASGAALLKLARGGEVRVCRDTSLTVTASSGGRSLMLGMGSGAIEIDYSLPASADSIVTPDFRLLLAGPGDFRFAVSSDAAGNTCVRALPSNTASIIVSELMGDGSYQVKPDETVVLRRGRVSETDSLAPPECGCSPAAPPHVLKADAPRPQPTPEQQQPPALPAAETPRMPADLMSAAEPLPPSTPGEVHVQVDAPFVFRADEPASALEPPTVARLAFGRLPIGELPPAVLPPPQPPRRELPLAQPKPKKKGPLSVIGSFFARLFGGGRKRQDSPPSGGTGI